MDFTGFRFSKFNIAESFKKIKEFKFNKSDVLLLIFVAFAGVIYVVRSSNWAFVSNFERRARDALERALIARPRTKELISYLFYYTTPLSGRRFIWDFFKALLPVSILDTFLHIHTPLNLSVLRTINGFLVSLLLLLVIILIENLYRKFLHSGQEPYKQEENIKEENSTAEEGIE